LHYFHDRLMPATAEDLADAVAFALRFDGQNRKSGACEIMSIIAAKHKNSGR
jgi:hypothetical protein